MGTPLLSGRNFDWRDTLSSPKVGHDPARDRVAHRNRLAGLAIAGTPAATALIYGISPSDPRVIGGAALGLTAIAMIASFLPARRAAAIDPAAALRRE
jgi:ABC-type antimicrobial peptide transport system permease subunit